MIKKLFTLSLILLSIISQKISAQSLFQMGTTNVTIDTVYTGLDVPWEIIYGPDNKIWVTERKGLVSRIDPVTKIKDTILDIRSFIYAQSEAGLLGMKLHPNYPAVKEVFLVYTYPSNNTVKERLTKYTFNDTNLVYTLTLIDDIEAGINHNGSRIIFLPDTTILMTTGDNLVSSNAQDLSSLNGKILRLTTSGGVPADNPIAGSFIYSYGHRNPQGLLLAPNGKIYESEHGASTDDEFQIIDVNRNYGWPLVEGFCDSQTDSAICSNNNIHEPLMHWTPTIAPGDLAYYSNPAFPELDNCILMTALKDKKMVAIKLNAAGTVTVSQTAYFTNMFGRLRDVCTGPLNEIYLATNGADASNLDSNTHSIIKITISQPLSVKENKSEYMPLVYPTVANDYVTIELQNTGSGRFNYSVTDITGKVLIKESFSGNKHQASIAGLSQGIYFLTLQKDSKQFFAGKIIHE